MKFLRTTEFRVGFLVFVVVTLLAVMIVQVSEDPSFYGRTQKAWFIIDDASGLVKNSQVKMAGIGIGVIKSITLQDGQARVDMVLRKDIRVTKKTTVDIRSNGILGDRHVELVAGDPDAELLPEGDPIMNVRNNSSLDIVMKKVGNVTDSLDEVATSLKKATTEGDKSTTIGRILNNLDHLTQDLSDFTHGNKDKLSDIVDNLHDTTDTINDLVTSEGDDGLRTAWKSAVASLQKLDHSMSNVEQITEKVNQGKGSLGKLVNDEETVQEINKAVAGVNQFLGTTNRLQANLDVRSEYLMSPGLYKTSVNVRLQPGLDRYYELGIVADPKGVVETTQVQSSTNPGGPTASDPTTTEKKVYKNRIKINAIFAKNFYDFTIKGGLIESSGGVGLDYNMFRRKLRFSVEMFDVSERSMRLRSGLRYSFMRGVYVTGGADDLTSKSEVTSYLGAGFDLSNDDLKSLVSFLF